MSDHIGGFAFVAAIVLVIAVVLVPLLMFPGDGRTFTEQVNAFCLSHDGVKEMAGP
jgi:hypothetical protein